jgi:hypothetical protein
MTNDTPADVATGSDTKEPTIYQDRRPHHEGRGREGYQVSSQQELDFHQDFHQAGTKATQEDPGEESSSSDNSSSSSADDGGTDQSSSDHEEDPTFHHSIRTGADPFSPEWYQSKTRTYIEETFQVPRSHRHNYPRPLLSGMPASTELCPAARPEPVKRPRFCTLRLSSWDSSSTEATLPREPPED